MVRLQSRKRVTVGDARGFCAWAQSATAGERCTYHMGNLVPDRERYPELNLLAETVLLLQEAHYVMGQRLRLPLAGFDGYEYLVVRSGIGSPPRSVLNGTLTATQYRALVAIGHRASAVSITRAVRDACSISEAAASALVDALRKRGLVSEQPVKGWEVSSSGSKLL